uniref:Uncharacterized protein n=1 Tax=Anguilla anguilla TaxID=7936 RepID=A0A0E9PXE1_ANGAN
MNFTTNNFLQPTSQLFAYRIVFKYPIKLNDQHYLTFRKAPADYQARQPTY